MPEDCPKPWWGVRTHTNRAEMAHLVRCGGLECTHFDAACGVYRGAEPIEVEHAPETRRRCRLCSKTGVPDVLVSSPGWGQMRGL